MIESAYVWPLHRLEDASLPEERRTELSKVHIQADAYTPAELHVCSSDTNTLTLPHVYLIHPIDYFHRHVLFGEHGMTRH